MQRIPLVRHGRVAQGAEVLRASCVALVILLASIIPSTLPADEALRAGIEARAVEPRMDGVAVADPPFLIRSYARRQFSPAWESEAKRDGLLDASARSAGHGPPGRDARVRRALEEAFEFAPPVGYEDSLSANDP